jgi:hypothetical protein
VALLAEGALIQILATIPFGLLLTVAFPRRGEWIAMVLSAIFALHVVRDSSHVSGGVSATAFLLYMALSHFVFLTGTTVIGRRLRLLKPPSNSAIIPLRILY